MNGEICQVCSEEWCGIRVVTVLQVVLGRKDNVFLHLKVHTVVRPEIHAAHSSPSVTCDRSSETVNGLSVSFFLMAISNLGTWWSRGWSWTVLCIHWHTKFLKDRSNHFLNAPRLLALKVVCGKRIVQFNSPAGRKLPFLFFKCYYWWLLLQAIQDFCREILNSHCY